MKTWNLIILSAMIFVMGKIVAQPCADPANIYSFMHGGKLYEIVKEKKTWENAAACAVERGGYLVEINDQAEQDAVYSDGIVTGAGITPTYTVSPDGGGIAYVWIGATDKVTEGTWLWDGDNNGSGLNFWTGQGAAGTGGGSAQGGSYINWGGTSTGTPNEPDNWNNQDAAGIGLAGWPSGTTMLGIPGEWNDISITNQMYFVIEYDFSWIQGKQDEEWKFLQYPGTCTVRITGDGSLIREVRLFSILGTLLHDFHADQKEIALNLDDLAQGIYILSVESATGKVTNRRIILPF